MNALQMLKASKKRLARNCIEMGWKEQFICHALEETYKQNYPLKSSFESLCELKSLIKERMSNEYTLEDWLVKYHGIVEPSWNPRTKAEEEAEVKHIDKMQATRHAWVDSLIAEFSAKSL